MTTKEINEVPKQKTVVIRFSGDSGDGMQLTGTLFSETVALLSNAVATFPDYPAEIRAPQGTVGGVSGFQVHFGQGVHTPGDYADLLVAMNPAALMANAKWAQKGGMIILDKDAFTPKNLKRAGFQTDDPVAELKLRDAQIHWAPISTLTKESLKDTALTTKAVLRSKNMFALGLCFYIFKEPLQFAKEFFETKFKNAPEVIQANKTVLKAGYNYGHNILIMCQINVKTDSFEKGAYRNINGNTATAWGFMAAAEKAKLNLFCGSYPITPATDILHELAKHKYLGVKTFQAEDEIAGITSAVGASFAGELAITTTSGPGLALKTEAIGLAVITELPIVIVDVQRGGPSTGLPTKTEQSDLLQAVQGRNGEAPLIVIAASTPANCYDYAYQAAKLALEHMTPVILLTDGFIANGSQPMCIKKMAEMPEITVLYAKYEEGKDFLPYKRDTEKLARTWAVPGTPHLMHRIGGLEKMNEIGNVSYVPENHAEMTRLRQAKVDKVAHFIPKQSLILGEENSDLLIIGWGSTSGHLLSATEHLLEQGKNVAYTHFNYIQPLPINTLEILQGHKKIVVAEINNGQFAKYLRQQFENINFLQYNKVMGLPFTVRELKNHFNELLEEK